MPASRSPIKLRSGNQITEASPHPTSPAQESCIMTSPDQPATSWRNDETDSHTPPNQQGELQQHLPESVASAASSASEVSTRFEDTSQMWRSEMADLRHAMERERVQHERERKRDQERERERERERDREREREHSDRERERELFALTLASVRGAHSPAAPEGTPPAAEMMSRLSGAAGPEHRGELQDGCQYHPTTVQGAIGLTSMPYAGAYAATRDVYPPMPQPSRPTPVPVNGQDPWPAQAGGGEKGAGRTIHGVTASSTAQGAVGLTSMPYAGAYAATRDVYTPMPQPSRPTPVPANSQDPWPAQAGGGETGAGRTIHGVTASTTAQGAVGLTSMPYAGAYAATRDVYPPMPQPSRPTPVPVNGQDPWPAQAGGEETGAGRTIHGVTASTTAQGAVGLMSMPYAGAYAASQNVYPPMSQPTQVTIGPSSSHLSWPAQSGREVTTTDSHHSQLTALIARQSMATDLPPFDGDPLEWTTWHAQFRQSSDACSLTNAENLIRLQKSLRGRARDNVTSLLADPGKVDLIVSTLQTLFGSPHDIAAVTLHRVRKLPPLPEQTTNDQFMEFAAAVCNLVSSLHSLPCDYYSNPALLSELTAKIPFYLRVTWLGRVGHLQQSGQPVNVHQFAGFLRELSDRMATGGCHRNHSVKPRTRRENLHHITTLDSGLYSESEDSDSDSDRQSEIVSGKRSNTQVSVDSRSVKCLQCKKVGHKLKQCPEFLEATVKVRDEMTKAISVCRRCLGLHGNTRQCKRRCSVTQCRKAHHRMLHDSPTEAQLPSDSRPATVHHVCVEGEVLLKVAQVSIQGPSGRANAYALLDEGSSITLLDANTARQIGVQGPTRSLLLHGAGGMCTSDKKSQRVSLAIQGDGSSHSIAACTVEGLDLPEQPLPDGQIVQPTLLVGMDNAHIIVSREIREKQDGHIVSRTALGWIAHGVSRACCTSVSRTSLELAASQPDVDDSITELIKLNFAVDSIGITAATRVNAADLRARELMESTTRRLPDGSWETGLLWKEPASTLPDNRTCAVKRLIALERKLARDPALGAGYRAKIMSLLAKGYARPLAAQEVGQLGDRRWYLPHFAVTNPHKPGKIRVVFDAASRCRGVSLNDRLLTGPDLLSSLLGNLLRFREGRVALSADIRDMFLRIKIRAADQPSQLFLWRSEVDQEPTTYMMMSMMFGATCSPSSAQFVRNKTASEYAHTHPRAAQAISRRFYMDDYLDAVDTPAEAAAVAKDVKEVLRANGFDLINWASNDAEALHHIPVEDRSARTAVPVANVGPEEPARILGLEWDPVTDQFRYSFREAADLGERPTKRQLLSAVMRIFDPVGFISCLTIRSKILLQDVWRSSVSWDEPIHAVHAEKWRSWVADLRSNSVTIPRRAVQVKSNAVVLHMFCDASELACCAVAYAAEHNSEHTSVRFLASKCKVAPLKPLSVPRLELQGALMAARLAHTIRRESQLNIVKTFYWTDSTTVLCWLRTDPRTYSAFVANRLGEIEELTDVAGWRWVPTKLNPADEGTRDEAQLNLTPEGIWFKGPAYLTAPENAWPKEKLRPLIPDDTTLEVRPRFVGVTATKEYMPDLGRFSTWRRLVRTRAWMMRFINKCRKRPSHAGTELKPQETYKAEEQLTIDSQLRSFGSEPLQARRLTLHAPILGSDGVLRIGSRLSQHNNDHAPVLLDGTDAYTRLLLRHYHEKARHPSTEKAIADVRGSFEVLKLRTALRAIAFKCTVCRLQRCQPKAPQMGRLPPQRSTRIQPFAHCGLDYFGPMEVTVGRRKEKRYGALFTCLATRAVHLELATSLSADSAIMAVQRMTARRGCPVKIYSDNATNFHGAARELQLAWEEISRDPRMRNHMTSEGMEWEFIPPMSPHMGGAWERLVRSVKKALGAILKERAPKEETLMTALAEAEFTVNNRPLTHVAVDPRDDTPLTPNHFLLGTACRRPHLSLWPNTPQNECLRKQWRFSQQLADNFWKRWLREYIPNLALRQKWGNPVPPIKVGDLVLITDPALPRNTWPRGRVLEASPAADGQVRVVRVQTNTGEYTRPATKIATFMSAPQPPPKKGSGRAGRRRPKAPSAPTRR